MADIVEKDWKKLREMKDDLLDIACDRILNKIEILVTNRKGKKHKTYLNLWKMIKEEDKQISKMFDDPKRSNAIYQISELFRNNLITDKTLKEFTEETQEKIKLLNQIKG